jgi:predicted nucleotidyltransferase
MTRKRRSYDAVVRAVERALTAAGVDHVFVGGIAVIAFGRKRTTEDVDVLAAFREADVRPLLVELRRRGFRASEPDLVAALTEGEHCTIDDTRSEYRVDLSSAATDSARHALRHRVTIRSRGVELPIARPEHTIVMKLKFGSEQDLEDALAIYLKQKGRLDLALLAGFAAKQGVLTALASLRRTANGFEAAPRGRGPPGRDS